MYTRKDNLSPAMLTYYKEPLLIHKGSMQWLWDHEGRKYLDMFGGTTWMYLKVPAVFAQVLSLCQWVTAIQK